LRRAFAPLKLRADHDEVDDDRLAPLRRIACPAGEAARAITAANTSSTPMSLPRIVLAPFMPWKVPDCEAFVKWGRVAWATLNVPRFERFNVLTF
jgi:hypothetical protein